MAQTKILGDQIDQTTLTGLAPITHASQHYPAGADPVNAQPWHGVVSRTTVLPLPTNLTTTTFTLATAATPMTYYNNGVKRIVNTDRTCTMQGTGLNYIYFNTSDVLTCSQTFPGLTPDSGNVIIAMVFWNGSNFGAVLDERHGYTRDSAWHIWAHNTIGARYGAGLTFTFAGTDNTNTTFQISSGNIYDEDLNFTIGNTTACRIFRQTAASTFVLATNSSTLPYLYSAGLQAVRSDTFALVTITAANRYFNVWVYGITDVQVPVLVIAETVAPANVTGYTSVGNARAVSPPNLQAPSGLSPEVKLLYRLVVNGDGQIQTPVSADDYRLTQPLPSGGVASSTASSVSYTPTAPDGSLNVQAALDARYVVTPGTSGNLLTSNGTTWTSAAPATAGTVTAVSVATANGVSGSSSGGATPALTIALGAITPSTVNGNTITTGTGVLTLAASKTLTCDNTLTLAGTDSKTLTISNSLTLAGTDSTTMTFPPASASIGYLNIPQNSQSAAYTTVLADAGKHIFHPVGDGTPRTYTIDSNANVAYPVGTTITFINRSASAVTIAITSDTLTWAPAGTTGSRTLAQYGVATATKIVTTEWIISGVGLT